MTPLPVSYPFVVCPDHVGPQQAFMVCVHCDQAGAPVVHLVEATDQEPGEALCATCHAHADTITADDLLLVCRGCFDQFFQRVQ
jgi:hypothetical protein